MQTCRPILPDVETQWAAQSASVTERKMTKWVSIAAIVGLSLIGAIPTNVIAAPDGGPSKAEQAWWAALKKRVAEEDRCALRAASSVATCLQAFGVGPERPASPVVREICMKYATENEKECQGVKSNIGMRHLSRMMDVGWRAADPKCAWLAALRAAMCVEIVEGSVKLPNRQIFELKETCLSLGNAVAAQCSGSRG